MALDYEGALRAFHERYEDSVADDALRDYAEFDRKALHDFRGGDNSNDIMLGNFIRDYRAAFTKKLEDIIADNLSPSDAARSVNEFVATKDDAYENRYGLNGKVDFIDRWERNGEEPSEEEVLAAEKAQIIWHSILQPQYLVYFAILILLFTFFRAFMVPSGSMLPTLQENDRILTLARYFPDGHTYKVGDIVCFHEPEQQKVYVKRIVACGGDTVSISGETLYVNGEESPYQGGGTGRVQVKETKLADDEYYMMGDNRSNSQDSRYIGAIKADAIIGKVDCIFWPPNRFTKFDGSGLFGL